MDIKGDLLRIIDDGGHYLEVLNRINRYLQVKDLAECSAFFFQRRGRDYLVASFGECRDDECLRIILAKRGGRVLGFWKVASSMAEVDLEVVASYLSRMVFFDEWEYDYAFTQNRGCEYFPCHKVADEDCFSCLFCYCPLYLIPECGGRFSLLPNGMKDCSDCLLPHKRESYDYVIGKLSGFHKG